VTWLLNGVPTDWTGGEYRWALTLSFEIGGRAYETMRREHEARSPVLT